MLVFSTIAEIWRRLGWQLKTIVGLLVFIVVLFVSGLIWHSCTKKGLEDEIRREKEARSTEHQERIEEKKEEVNAAANISNQAKENLNKAANKDSAVYQATEAENKFCERYVCDSSCFEWRRKNNRECD
jgi:mannitol-specific phosphotransferase system IIBC component